MRTFRKKLGASMLMLAAFALWTAAVCCVDVQSIGPMGTSVGLAGINFLVELGVNLVLNPIISRLLAVKNK